MEWLIIYRYIPYNWEQIVIKSQFALSNLKYDGLYIQDIIIGTYKFKTDVRIYIMIFYGIICQNDV